MLDSRLTDADLVVLELIDGLGGDAHSEHLRELIRNSLKTRCKPTLIDLFNRGLLFRYAPGHYGISQEGREALAHARSLAQVDRHDTTVESVIRPVGLPRDPPGLRPDQVVPVGTLLPDLPR